MTLKEITEALNKEENRVKVDGAYVHEDINEHLFDYKLDYLQFMKDIKMVVEKGKIVNEKYEPHNVVIH